MTAFSIIIWDAMKVDVLFFGVHPDDVELCCGGMIAKMAEEGLLIGICDLTKGEAGTKADEKIREKEARIAAEILGVKERILLDLGDARLFDEEEKRKIICRIIRTLCPDIVIMPSAEERHPDHRIAPFLIKAALFLAKLKKVEPSLPPHAPSIILEYPMHAIVSATVIVDITKTFKKKMEAIDAYASQVLDDYKKKIEARDRLYGSLVQVEYGEPLIFAQPLKIPHPSFLLCT